MDKRARAPNFTIDEKLEVVHTAKKYKHILECRKTDKVTHKDKETCWQKITNEFNSRSPAGVVRTTENLKGFYENQKKMVRKIAARERQESMKTGGGAPDTPFTDDPITATVLELINKKTVYGLENKFDDESIYVNNTVEIDPTREEFEVPLELEDTDIHWGNYTTENLKKPLHPKLATTPIMPKTSNYVDTDESEHNYNTKNNATVPEVCKRKMKSLAQGSFQRRRPALASTSTLARKYEDMADVKLNMASVQNYLLEESKTFEARRMCHEEEKFRLEKEILEIQREAALIELKIKKVQLKKLLD